MTGLYDYDAAVAAEGYPVVCGVDEAGRGPLAGRVYAAACILAKEPVLEGIDDSKKLTAKKRDVLYDLIIENCVDFAVAFADEKEIDEINILEASMLAMRRAAAQLSVSADIYLIDGNRHPRIPALCRPIVKGDGKSAAVAAASVLAKVSRDRYMEQMDIEYPGYGFAVHKGYPTAAHYAALARLGPCDIHRITFLKNMAQKHPQPNKGAAGEQLAADWLTSMGWTVTQRNFRTPEGEIDIIALDGDTAVFVEVKQRSEGAIDRPANFVDGPKQARLKKAAFAWLEKNKCSGGFRFDVLEILGSQINLIKNAF